MSEIPKALQTAEIITEITGKEFVRDQRLNEHHKETWQELVARVEGFLAEMNASKHENLFVGSHGAVIAVLTNHINKGRFKVRSQFEYPKPAGLFVIKGGVIEEINF